MVDVINAIKFNELIFIEGDIVEIIRIDGERRQGRIDAIYQPSKLGQDIILDYSDRYNSAKAVYDLKDILSISMAKDVKDVIKKG